MTRTTSSSRAANLRSASKSKAINQRRAMGVIKTATSSPATATPGSAIVASPEQHVGRQRRGSNASMAGARSPMAALSLAVRSATITGGGGGMVGIASRGDVMASRGDVTPTKEEMMEDARAGNTTPPPPVANGVDGFMFTSPVRTNKKANVVHSVTPMSRRQLFPGPSASGHQQQMQQATISQSHVMQHIPMQPVQMHGHASHHHSHVQMPTAIRHMQAQTAPSIEQQYRQQQMNAPNNEHPLHRPHPHTIEEMRNTVQSALPGITGPYHFHMPQHHEQPHHHEQPQQQYHAAPTFPNSLHTSAPASTRATPTLRAPSVTPSERLARSARCSPTPAESENILFSPYPVNPNPGHNYNTRAAARQKQRATPSVSVDGTDATSVQMSAEEEERARAVSRYRTEALLAHETLDIDDDEPAQSNEQQDADYNLDLSDLDTDEAYESMAIVYNIHNNPERGRPPRHDSALPEKRDDKITLVLDLDETLVHCSVDQEDMPDYEIDFMVNFQNRDFRVYVKKRPHVIEFLKRVSKEFEVVIFTASQRIYADKLLDLMDPDRQFTQQRRFRDSCVLVDGVFVKDLTVLGRDLSRVVIVDNAVEAFALQINNGIPIKTWTEDTHDNEMIRLHWFLQTLKKQTDVRPFLWQSFAMERRISAAARLHGLCS